MLFQKSLSEGEFFLESLYDPEVMALASRSKDDLEYHKSEVKQKGPADPIPEGGAV
jgi:hypothetical protein